VITGNRELVTVFPDTSIHEAARRMISRNLQQVPDVSPAIPKSFSAGSP
jgi:CBS domain-containing protein